MRLCTGIAVIALLSACGGSESTENAAASGSTESASDIGATPAGLSTADQAKFKAALADPCAFVGNDAVAAATGQTVNKTMPLPSTKPDDVDAYCQFDLSDGVASVDVTYNSLNPGYFDSAEIASRRDIAEGTSTKGKKLEDVPGIGDAAYYDPNREQLTVFKGGAVQAIFAADLRRGGDPKAMTMAMAKSAGF